MTPKKPKSENSIVDIAKALGISPATVSRALNNNLRISEATRARVKEMAKEMGYRHNSMASSLRNRRSNIIGLIVPRISMYFHVFFITSLQRQLQAAGYNLMICQSNDSVSVEKELANTLYSARVDALVVSLTLYTENIAHFDGFLRQGIPLVFYDRVPTRRTEAYVIKGDDYRGGLLAGNHLIQAGCQRIAYISGPLSCSIYQERTRGFVDSLAKHHIPLRQEWIYYHELTAENAWDSLRKLFEGDIIPDGLFAANDTTAIAAVAFARERGIAIPDELKIVGYSNDPRAAIITPAITSIEQYPNDMADKVAETLINALQHRHTPSPNTIGEPLICPVDLVRRMTT
ncbi:LacI family DNA-binding transcriptional regulator [Parapedobacter sp. ISTM3]|uniref:Transcriptional regulator, LacI family n=1 Tax=Parapedobacter luteus TaxID=623280 RepID=A0A1T4ZSL8_9SPHI|nr:MULTISPECIES: LacI family DNA-binding transcriptional regulator [Parapedobacter]MBK1438574.1 LacI family DNA-binding transcriptional regulator [Parapedobacter sp. ISTM3]SKB25752.1 transcriptional regulator, LacI family [Parapedobacter luteus]